MLIRNLVWTGTFLSASLAISACSSTDDPAHAASDAGIASDASSADASKPKPGSDLPVVTLGQGTTQAASGPVKCGSKMCTAPAGAMVMNVACCLPDDSCGAKPDLSSLGMGLGMSVPTGAAGDATGGCLDVAPGKPDTSCPSQSIMGFALAGCCSKAGVCGVDLSVGGLGCNSISALGALASLAGGGAMDAGAPIACGGGGGGKDVDASVIVLDAAAPAADGSVAVNADAAPRSP